MEYRFSEGGKILYEVAGYLRRAEIPEGVEIIAEGCFRDRAGVIEATFPESLRVIEDRAFYSTGLRSITLGPNLKEIGKEAFGNCPELMKVEFSEGLKTLGDRAFLGSPVYSVHLPASLSYLGESCFHAMSPIYYHGKQTLTIDSKNPWYHQDAYAIYETKNGRKAIISVYGKDLRNPQNHIEYELEENTQEIKNSCFRLCQGLRKLILPKQLRVIGNQCFRDAAVQEIDVAEGNSEFGILGTFLMQKNEILLYDFGVQAAVNIPEGVTGIAPGAFRGKPLKDVFVPESVIHVGEDAFRECEYLTWVYIQRGSKREKIYLPISAERREIHKAYLNCLKMGQDEIFPNYEEYDGVFVKLASSFKTQDIRQAAFLALSRLQNPYHLRAESRAMYEDYLIRNAREAALLTAEQDDLESLHRMEELGILTDAISKEVFELAVENQKTEITGYLLRKGRKSQEQNFEDYDL